MSNNANTGTIQIASAAGMVFAPVLSNDFVVFSSQSNTSMYLGASNAPNFLQISSNFAYTSNLNTSNLTVGGVLSANGAINATGQTVTASTFVGALTGNASTATTATSASTATFATAATNSSNASNAIYATSAGSASTATSATTLSGNPAIAGILTTTTLSNIGTFSNGAAFSNFGTFCNVGNAFFGSDLTVRGTTIVQNITVSNVETLVQSFSNQGTMSNIGAAVFGSTVSTQGLSNVGYLSNMGGFCNVGPAFFGGAINAGNIISGRNQITVASTNGTTPALDIWSTQAASTCGVFCTNSNIAAGHYVGNQLGKDKTTNHNSFLMYYLHQNDLATSNSLQFAPGGSNGKLGLYANGLAAIGSTYSTTYATLSANNLGNNNNGLIVEGNVGIGTSNPQQQLEVAGNAVFYGNISAGNMGMFRNYVINGAMQVNQRGITSTPSNVAAATGSMGYPADRFVCFRGAWAAGAQISYQSTSSTDLPFTKAGIQNYIRFQRQSGNTDSNNGMTFGTMLEGLNTRSLAGNVVTLSFYYRAGEAFSNTFFSLTPYITQNSVDYNYSAGVGNIATLNLTNLTSSTTWQYYQASTQISSATYQASIGFYLGYKSGTAGASDYLDITGVQLEKGTIATPFEFRPYPIELQLCQRYYWQLNAENGYTALGSGFAANNKYIQITTYPVKMRVAPTISGTGGVIAANNGFGTNLSNTYSNLTSGTNLNIYNASTTSTYLELSGVTLTFSNCSAFIQSANNTSTFIGFSAEL